MVLEFNAESTQILNQLAVAEGKPVGEIVREAMALYSFIKREGYKNKDYKLAILDANNTPVKEIILP